MSWFMMSRKPPTDRSLSPGDLFDLRDGYDLSDEGTQAYVIRRVRETNPKLLIGNPPCTMFSRLQALNIHVQGELQYFIQTWMDFQNIV